MSSSGTKAPLNLLCVLGTRPEAIKLAPVILELRRRAREGGLPATIRTRVCVTGQHREMLDPMLPLFGIEPDHDLDVMQDDQSPSRLAASVLTGLERILEAERPDWVLVQGDTTTVAAASIAAYHAGVKVAHVEAGLRTSDKWRPFPEEINRRVTTVIADLHLAPTERARRNLLREGVPDERIRVTGNPVVDALQLVARMPSSERATALLHDCGLDRTRRDSKQLILVTAHRRENHGEPLVNICRAVRELVTGDDDVRVIYPVHLNPHVWGPVHELLGHLPGVILTPPLDYLSMVHLLERCDLVLTDSGGLQEEAPVFGVPVLVLREITERPEGIEAGLATLVGTARARIVSEAQRLLGERDARKAGVANPYGDGLAASRIVTALLEADDREPVPRGPAVHHASTTPT
jgi:UDP-N-acetylglucosamine 2-epimerase (non-hydrolysing)